jgi:tetratricopeptide (TPR) repeat protein
MSMWAALSVAAPAMAQGATTGGIDAALKQAETLRTQRRFSEMLPVLQPFADSKNFDVYIAIGRAYEGLRLPEFCMTAVQWHSKAIDLQPNNPNGYERRAAAYDCQGNPYFQPELTDREKYVALDEAGPTKLSSAGRYNDLAGAIADMAAPTGQGQVDFSRAQRALELRSKAIAMTPVATNSNLRDKAGRLMDRAELMNSRFANPGAARVDADAALDIARNQLDMSDPANWYSRAEINRRYGALGSTIIAAVSLPGFGIFRPTQASMRNEALAWYSKYIDAFEASGQDFVKYGSGIDAYTNRASNYNNMGDPASKRKAIENYTRSFQLDPNNFRRLWDRAQRNIELGTNAAAIRADIQQYLDMTKGVDVQAANGRMLDFLRRNPG